MDNYKGNKGNTFTKAIQLNIFTHSINVSDNNKIFELGNWHYVWTIVPFFRKDFVSLDENKIK